MALQQTLGRSKGFLKSSAAAGKSIDLENILIRHHIFASLTSEEQLAKKKKKLKWGDKQTILLRWFILCSLVNELALTARKMYADEAKSSGLVR